MEVMGFRGRGLADRPIPEVLKGASGTNPSKVLRTACW